MFSDVFAIWCVEMLAGVGALLVLVFMDRRATRGRDQTVHVPSSDEVRPAGGEEDDDELRLEQCAAIVEVERLLRSTTHPSKDP